MKDERRGYVQGICCAVVTLLTVFGNNREVRRLWSGHDFTLREMQTAGVDEKDIKLIKQNFVLIP